MVTLLEGGCLEVTTESPAGQPAGAATEDQAGDAGVVDARMREKLRQARVRADEEADADPVQRQRAETLKQRNLLGQEQRDRIEQRKRDRQEQRRTQQPQQPQGDGSGNPPVYEW